MNDARERNKKRDQDGDGRLAGAVDRLERALEEAADAGDAATGVAAAYVDAAAARLKADARRRSARGSRDRRSSGSEPAQDDESDWGWGWWGDGRSGSWPSFGSRELRRDRERGKIGGVCAGFANYFGVEPWVVRCVAVTGLIFLPQVVFPAYWIAFFIMDRPRLARPGRRGRPRQPRPSRGRGPRRHAGRAQPEPQEEPVEVAADGVPAFGGSQRHNDLAPRISPRRHLRHVHAEFDQVELRLRRMETHITSGQYELQRELTRIARTDS